MVNDYLRFQIQKGKNGYSCSGWADISKGYSQGIYSEASNFEFFINDIFLFIEKFDICNYAGDNTLLSCGDDFFVMFEESRAYDNSFRIFQVIFLKKRRFFTESKTGWITFPSTCTLDTLWEKPYAFLGYTSLESVIKISKI